MTSIWKDPVVRELLILRWNEGVKVSSIAAEIAELAKKPVTNNMVVSRAREWQLPAHVNAPAQKEIRGVTLRRDSKGRVVPTERTREPDGERQDLHYAAQNAKFVEAMRRAGHLGR